MTDSEASVKGCGVTRQKVTDPGPVQADNENPAARMTVGRQKMRLLVVEDMAELADVLVHTLETLEIEAQVASTGKEALQLLRSGSFDAALVDIELTDTTGFELVEAANASGWLGKTHIVFCTGSRSEEYRQRAARFSGCSFLWKPFAVHELMKCLEVQKLS